ncbi:MAG: hypothetical protein Q8K78_03400 [Planctomycetaceae bacterium]|nr:hypothetical protein [Planctomycetaceae bacterium]
MAPARAVLLLITVALFAAAWSGDHPVVPATAMATPSLIPPATTSLDLGPLVQTEPFAPSLLTDARFAVLETSAGRSGRWMSSLPIGVTPGTYLVVHADGRTEQWTISADMLHAHGHDPDVRPQTTYTATVDGATLVLVRIQPPSQRAVIAEGDLGRRRM